MFGSRIVVKAMTHPLKVVTSEDAVEVFSNASRVWIFQIANLILIGEYTTNEGPYRDDYFVEFVTVEDGTAMFSKVSFYAEGIDEAITGLGEKLGQSIHLELYASADWNSRIVWPSALSGRPYLAKAESRAKGVFGALARRFKSKYVVSDDVRNYIDERTQGRKFHRPQR
jgi:hypothetical protein